MNIRPFAAVRPTSEAAPLVASVPYDVVDTAEARALAAGNPSSFLHVSRPEIDMPDGTDCSSPEAYAQAKRALETLLTTPPVHRAMVAAAQHLQTVPGPKRHILSELVGRGRLLRLADRPLADIREDHLRADPPGKKPYRDLAVIGPDVRERLSGIHVIRDHLHPVTQLHSESGDLRAHYSR